MDLADFLFEDSSGKILHQGNYMRIRQQAFLQVIGLREKILVQRCGIKRQIVKFQGGLGKDIGRRQLFSNGTAVHHQGRHQKKRNK